MSSSMSTSQSSDMEEDVPSMTSMLINDSPVIGQPVVMVTQPSSPVKQQVLTTQTPLPSPIPVSSPLSQTCPESLRSSPMMVAPHGSQITQAVNSPMLVVMQEESQTSQHGSGDQQMMATTQAVMIASSPAANTSRRSPVILSDNHGGVSQVPMAPLYQQVVVDQSQNQQYSANAVPQFSAPSVIPSPPVCIPAISLAAAVNGSASPATVSIQRSSTVWNSVQASLSAPGPIFLSAPVASPSSQQPLIIQPAPVFSSSPSTVYLPSETTLTQPPPLTTQPPAIAMTTDVSEKSVQQAGTVIKKTTADRKRTKMIPIAPKPEVKLGGGTQAKPAQQGFSSIFLHPDPAQVNMLNQDPSQMNSWNLLAVPFPSCSIKAPLTSSSALSGGGLMKGRHMMRLHDDGRTETGGITKKAKLSDRQSSITKTTSVPSGMMSPNYTLNSQDSMSSMTGPDIETRRRRYQRTREVLEKSGLMDITMQTASLIKSNWLIGNEIELLQKETASLIKGLLEGNKYMYSQDSNPMLKFSDHSMVESEVSQRTSHFSQFDKQMFCS